MSLPHFSTLQKITELERKISLLQTELSELESNLSKSKDFYKNAEKQEYNRLLEIHTQENLLESIQNEISELRSKEQTLQAGVNNKIQTAIDSFISKEGYAELIQKIWEAENVKNPNLYLELSQDMKDFGAKYPHNIIEGKEFLRIVSNQKTYILDKNILIAELKQKLFVKILSS